MEENVIQRIRLFMKDCKISVTKLSSIINVPQTTLNRQLSGTGEIPYYTIEQLIANFPNLSAEWLLRGKGEMYLQTPDSKVDVPADEVEILKDEILRLQGVVRALERIINGEKKALERRNVG